MANISAIKLPNGNTYDLVDKTSGYVTTDEKLIINQENSNNTYYPIISTSSTAASTKYIDTRGIRLDITNGTERSQGDITLILGNPTAVNYDGNKAGFLQLYSLYSGYAQIQTPSFLTSDVYLTLPSSTGTLALTSNIKDATLTIQKNGVNVETFSANASSDVTANITVPTKVSELTNDSGYITSAGVTGVKGNAESSYRTGQVNLTAANIGAIPANSNGNTQNLYRPIYLNGLNDNTLDQKISTLRANRLAFLPADQIIIEKTTDGGTTWVDAEVTDDIKLGLFSETRNSVYIPLLNGVKDKKCGIRITFTAMKYNVPSGTAETNKYNYWNSTYVVSQERYNQLKEMYFWVNANSDTIGVKLERATGAASTTWNTIFNDDNFCMTGWSGNDYIRFSQGVFGGGTNQTTNYWNYRLTFMTKGTSASHGDTMSTSSTTQAQSIMEIRGYGDTWWGSGNNYAAEDKIYTHDKYQNVIFPGNITPKVNNSASLGSSSYKWANIYATTFTGNLTGTASGNLTSSSTLDATKLSGAIPSAVTATTQTSTDNSTKIATTAYVTTAIANLPEPMLFKGSVGTNGTITSLPTAAAANEGFTYKVITALSTPVTAKVGDTVISNGSEWVVIPSGDEPSGTVTSVGLSNATNGGLTISGSPITSSGSITVGHSNVLTSAQTTQAIYPIKIDKNGHISAYGSAVTPLTASSTLDATKLSGTIPSNCYTDTNTTYALSNALSSHKFTSTLTAGGSGSGTSTATMEFVAGTGITLTDDTTNKKITIASSVTNTDEKLKVTNDAVDNTEYYPIFGSSSTSAETKKIDSSGFKFTTYNGTTSVTGSSILYLGNNTASGTAGNKIGYIKLYGSTRYSYTITGATLHPLADRTLTLPDKSGTIALTSDIPTIPSNNVTGSGSTDYLAKWSGTNTLSSSHLSTSTSYNSSSDLYGKAKFYIGDTGQIDWQGQLVFYSGNLSKTITVTPPSLTTKSRTLTLPDASGTIALTSDIPTISYPVTSVNSKTGAVTLTASEVGALPDTTPIPSKTSDLTNDSGFTTKNMWYGTCSTGASTAAKAVTTSSGDFTLTTGSMVRVKFTNSNSYDGTATLNVDGKGAKNITKVGANTTTQYYWVSGEVVDFVYDGTNFVMSGKGTASVTYYGLTKLSSATDSTSVTLAATPKAVKTAYDLANSKQAELVSGTNIKTINNTSLLGSGDISVAADGTPIPTASEVAEFDTNAHMNSTDMTSSEIEDFVEDLDMGASGLLNMFYPVGSYYETSDSTFDPNVRWGGTWVLETEGQVHVSAGVNYEIGDTGGEAEVTLTTGEIPTHTHGSKSLTGTLTSRRQGADYVSIWGSGIVSISVGGANVTSNSVGTSNKHADIATIDATHEHDSVGDGGAHNNMPPYVVVNRWHRTA